MISIYERPALISTSTGKTLAIQNERITLYFMII